MIEHTTIKGHRDRLIMFFVKLFTRKYDEGAKNHGGGLWKKPNLINEAIEETLDLWSYLATLQDQIDNLVEVLREEALPYANPQVKEAIIKAINQLGTDEE
jgi:hypothetical protein